MPSNLVTGEWLESRCNGADVVLKDQQAVLLSQRDLSLEDKRIGKLLSFFGVTWRTLSIVEILADSTASHSTAPNSRIFCSAEVLLQLIKDFRRDQDCMRFSWNDIHSAFVYAGNDSAMLLELARILTGD